MNNEALWVTCARMGAAAVVLACLIPAAAASAGDCPIPAFAAGQSLNLMTPVTRDVATADLDGDGLDDVAVLTLTISGDSDSWYLRTYLNHATAGFALHQSLHIADQPERLFAGDWSGDGAVDLIVKTQVTADKLQFYLNNGNGLLTFVPELTLNARVASLVIKDLDVDGFPDVTISISNDAAWNQKLLFLKGDGAGGFTESEIPISGVPYARDMEAVDLDGDSDIDLVLTGASGTLWTSIRKNDGSGGFTHVHSITSAGLRTQISSADVNGDGRPDLIYEARLLTTERALVYHNIGAGMFSSSSMLPAIPGAALQRIVAADLNGNGSDDLVGVGDLGFEGYVMIGENGLFNDKLFFARRVRKIVAGAFDAQPGMDLLVQSVDQWNAFSNLSMVHATVYSNRGLGIDCNLNDVGDSCEIVDGPADDCDLNTIPDLCQIADNPKLDCNNDGVLDACQDDCNGNGIHDSCDLTDGLLSDYNFNGVPDECESLDCNNNNQPDIIETATGAVADCNGNFVPDECELTPDGFGIDDGEPNEIWARNGPGWAIFGIQLDAGDGAIIDQVGMAFVDLGNGDIAIGDPMRVFVWEDPNDDGLPDDVVELTKRDVTVLALTPPNDIQHPQVNNWEVDPVSVTGKFFVGVAMPNDTGDPRDILLADRRGDYNPGFYGVFGEDTEAFRTAVFYQYGIQFLIRARAADCDENTIPDSCELNAGDLTDVNHDNVADECVCFADTSGDGNVNVKDLTNLLSQWTCTGDCAADFNGDGLVNVHDLFLLLAVWGACP